MKRFFLIAVVAACGAAEGPKLTPQQSGEQSAAAVAALQASKFEEAERQSTVVLAGAPHDSRAAAVRAIASYQIAGSGLVHELGAIIENAERLEFFDHAGGRKAWQGFLTKLEKIDRDLAVVAADPGFSLELCLACWEHDWNHTGEIDDRDRRLFELEVDGKGDELPEGDPRRRPTFHFDVGDAEWARAMIGFQRAFGELVLAYKWSELDKLFGDENPGRLVIRMSDAGRVKRARSLILAALGSADRCRAAYLAESDDDREWVPSPKQASHPVPLEVDDALYQTWAAVTGDVRRLLESEEGLSIREMARIADDDLGALAPDAYIDVGRMLAEPKDITITLDGRPDAASMAKLLQGLLGNGYRTGMKPSPMIARLDAMRQQLDRGEDTLDRKLRYLFWLN